MLFATLNLDLLSTPLRSFCSTILNQLIVCGPFFCADLVIAKRPNIASTYLSPLIQTYCLQLFFILFLSLLIFWAIIYLLLVTYCLSTKLFASSSTSTNRSLPTPMQSRSQFTIRLGATMGKSGDDKPGFSFSKLAGADNYKKWAREMGYSLESAGL